MQRAAATLIRQQQLANVMAGKRGFTLLQVEKPCPSLAHKVVRGELGKVYYTHPSYVMSREKMLYTLWVDHGVFAISWKLFIPFFTVAYFFKA